MKIVVRRHTPESPWTYSNLDQLQNEIAAELLAHPNHMGTVILSELAPIVTFGRRTPANDLLGAAETLEVARGGLATWHGPGQWVLFPVERLETLVGDRKGVRKAIDLLLQTAQQTAAEFGVTSTIRHGEELGVWAGASKIASVGIQIKKSIVHHGLSLNGYPTSESFKGLRACGLDSPLGYVFPAKPTTRADFEALGKAFLAQFAQVFEVNFER